MAFVGMYWLLVVPGQRLQVLSSWHQADVASRKLLEKVCFAHLLSCRHLRRLSDEQETTGQIPVLPGRLDLINGGLRSSCIVTNLVWKREGLGFAYIPIPDTSRISLTCLH